MFLVNAMSNDQKSAVFNKDKNNFQLQLL